MPTRAMWSLTDTACPTTRAAPSPLTTRPWRRPNRSVTPSGHTASGSSRRTTTPARCWSTRRQASPEELAAEDARGAALLEGAELALRNYKDYVVSAHQEVDLPKLAEAMHAQLPCFTVEELEHALK